MQIHWRDGAGPMGGECSSCLLCDSSLWGRTDSLPYFLQTHPKVRALSSHHYNKSLNSQCRQRCWLLTDLLTLPRSNAPQPSSKIHLQILPFTALERRNKDRAREGHWGERLCALGEKDKQTEIERLSGDGGGALQSLETVESQGLSRIHQSRIITIIHLMAQPHSQYSEEIDYYTFLIALISNTLVQKRTHGHTDRK